MASSDLTTEYLGLSLQTPFVASACPLTGTLESLQQLHDAGVSAVVLPSLFEEQIEHDLNQVDELYSFQSDSHAESLTYFPSLDDYNTGPHQYLTLIEQSKRRFPIPIIASLNGATTGGWVHYARLIEQAGADALELNIYMIPSDGKASSSDVESQYCDLVRAVRQTVNLPLAVKLGPYFSSLPHVASQLSAAGADGLVLFNRYLAPDIDLETLTFEPALELSSREELRVALRWIAILRDQTAASLAATGGIHDAIDAAKALLVGADALMLASVILTHGPRVLEEFRAGLEQWMIDHDYESVSQLKGSMSAQNCANPEGLNRANYMKALTTFTRADLDY